MPVTVDPRGPTIYKPEACLGGYTLFPYRVRGGPGAVLVEMNGCIFEVTPAKETVWEYVVPRGRANRAYRYGYDFSPQTLALGAPDEVAVLPENLPEPLAFSR